MSIKIQVTSMPIREMKGIGKVSGKPYHMRIQTAWAFTVSKDGVVGDFPDKFEVALEDDQQPYPPGVYQLSPASFFVGREYATLELRPRLVPLAAAK